MFQSFTTSDLQHKFSKQITNKNMQLSEFAFILTYIIKSQQAKLIALVLTGAIPGNASIFLVVTAAENHLKFAKQQTTSSNNLSNTDTVSKYSFQQDQSLKI
eukprot:TRINITY_DN2814_c0_g1_i12.p5 TRINITY_DN2814_c0_g1~~TRINITY_DN2814_c0_g1_i12.p5  ORF type:complete len:102 (+),score=4.75 TRINITY_DN2814_c0_g1_i12:383-688(+)